MWWIIKLSIVLQCAQSIRIVNMGGPDVIQYGSRDAVTLDCNYVTGNVTGLVVKWFFKDKSQPVYQWIPPQKPQPLGVLKGKLDLSYTVSENPYTKHRALRILSPGTELTGNYTCVVSTFLAEDEKTKPMTIFGNLCFIFTDEKSKPMTIFVPEGRFDIVQDRLSGGYLNIICSAEQVFPKPEIIILAGNRPLESKSVIKLNNDRYSIVTSSIVKIESLPPTAELLCDMQVPLANYFSRKRDIFYRDPPPTTPSPPNHAHTQARGTGFIHRPVLLILSIIVSLLTLRIT